MEDDMKRASLLGLLILLCASSINAVDFSPGIASFIAPSIVEYTFNGEELNIDVEVTGKPLVTAFMVYTKNEGDAIGEVQNGHLGWHYISHIDTCLYVSTETPLSVGSNTITWNGKDNDNGTVPPGEYTYYLWGFDNTNPKIPAIRSLGKGETSTVVYNDEGGNPLSNPVMYHNGNRKWTIGIDPDTPLEDIEYTEYTQPGSPWAMVIPDPNDHSTVYVQQATRSEDGGPVWIRKYNWVPNGEATLVTEWGESGEFTWVNNPGGAGTFGNGLQSDGGDILFASYCNQYDPTPASEVLYLSMADGIEIASVELSDWYCSVDDFDAGGQMNGGPSDLRYQNGILYTHGQQSCMILALDPTRDTDDAIVWINDNGDYMHDYHFDSDDATPWMCNDFMVGPYMYTYDVDQNGFSIFPAFDLGAVSFGLIGPDGTGLDYYAYGGETANWKLGTQYIDNDTPYDGLYTDNNSTSETDQAGIWYVANDSFKGTITSEPTAVTDEVANGFSVSQNTPNPFNPSTTISYDLAANDIVTIDVFNAAGQKVDTLVDTYQHAGSHTVTWNASSFSAGVYFYTVKSGPHSRTVKMTLIK